MAVSFQTWWYDSWDDINGSARHPETSKNIFTSQMYQECMFKSMSTFVVLGHSMVIYLGGGFKHWGIFTPNYLGKMNPFWRAYISNGLKLTTNQSLLLHILWRDGSIPPPKSKSLIPGVDFMLIPKGQMVFLRKDPNQKYGCQPKK